MAEAAGSRLAGLTGEVVLGIHRYGQRALNKLFSVAVGPAFESFGRSTVIELPTRINGHRRISLGAHVFVGSGSWLQALGSHLEGGSAQGGVLVVGDNTKIAGYCVLSSAEAVILGRSVLLARGVYIADHQHRFRDTDRPVVDEVADRVGPVEIGDGAWLGQNVVVGPGVRIGAGSVIGANSVVLTDVPDRSVAVGAPARVIDVIT